MRCEARCWNANRTPNEDHVCAWGAGTFKEALRADLPQKSGITAAHQDRHALKAIKEVVYHLAEVVNWQFSTSTWRRVLNNWIFCLLCKGWSFVTGQQIFFFIGLLSGTEALKSRVLLWGLFLLLVLAPFRTKATQKIETDHFFLLMYFSQFLNFIFKGLFSQEKKIMSNLYHSQTQKLTFSQVQYDALKKTILQYFQQFYFWVCWLLSQDTIWQMRFRIWLLLIRSC